MFKVPAFKNQTAYKKVKITDWDDILIRRMQFKLDVENGKVKEAVDFLYPKLDSTRRSKTVSTKSVFMAFEYLDAQSKTRIPEYEFWKPTVEWWSNHYISSMEVAVAAYLHPSIKGLYPLLNLKEPRVLPADVRLFGAIPHDWKPSSADTSNFEIQEMVTNFWADEPTHNDILKLESRQ